MTNKIPIETIKTFAKTICTEAKNYGFRQIDVIRLINEMMDLSGENSFDVDNAAGELADGTQQTWQVEEFPLTSARLTIRRADSVQDRILLDSWMADEYGKHFLLSSATAQSMDLQNLLTSKQNLVGIVQEKSGEEIGAVAFLGIDDVQRRAELRKLIGVSTARGKGYAEEATRLWILYGGQRLRLQKIYVSTLQTHLRNIQLNESIGFKVEGILRNEVLIRNVRHDVLRMGLSFDEFSLGPSNTAGRAKPES